MRTSEQGKQAIAAHEGCGLSVYYDSVGVRTIGIGCTVTEIPDIASWSMDKKITIEQAWDMFTKALMHYESPLDKALVRSIEQHQYDALVSLFYNVGVGYAATATAVKLLNQGVTDPDRLYNSIMLYNRPTEILGRRKKEARLFAYGEYPTDKITLFPISPTGNPIYNKGVVMTPPSNVETLVPTKTLPKPQWWEIIKSIFK